MYKSIDETAKLYKKEIIKGWDKLYAKKIKSLYQVLSKYYKGKHALELGCGDGESTKNILLHFKKLDVVDASLEQLEFINKKFPKTKTIHSYFEEFEPKNKYDTIFMTHVLEHLDKPKIVLDKAYNILKSNGVVLICVPNALSFHRLVGVKMGLLKSPYSLNNQDKKLGHRRVYDYKSMKELIKKTPFRIKKFTGLMLKPLSNRQIEKDWNDQLIDAFFKLGFDFPEHSSELIFILDKMK